jgi:tRNA threonylcarbamoyladenosine biosynthesis protein TsaE
MTDIIECKTISELDFAAEKLLNKFKNNKIFALYGLMGVGKTTFIKSICKYMGVKDIINSPTFALVNEYKTEKYGKIYHFDFYRINTLAEVYDMGYEDYFYNNNYCFIEWPEKIASLLPKDFVSLTIKENDGVRSIIF